MNTQQANESAPAALIRSRAGMRLIALLTIYNRGDFKRIREYLREQAKPTAFAEGSLAESLTELRLLRKRWGRLRYQQLIGISELDALVILVAEKDEVNLLAQSSVDAEYPHLLTHWQLNLLIDQPDEKTQSVG